MKGKVQCIADRHPYSFPSCKGDLKRACEPRGMLVAPLMASTRLIFIPST